MEKFDRRYILRTSLLSFAYLCGVAPLLRIEHRELVLITGRERSFTQCSRSR